MRQKLLPILIASFTLMGCSPSAEPSARTLDETYQIDLTSGSMPSLPSRGEAIIIYLIQGTQLVARPRVAPNPTTPAGILSILANGPTARELELGIRTAVGETVVDFEAAILESRMITVDISENFSELPGDEQTLLIAQIVLSLSEAFSITGVVITVNGEITPILGPNGEVLERAVTAADFRSVVTIN